MRFVFLVVVFFAVLGLLAALMIGVAIKIIALAAFGALAFGGCIWLLARFRQSPKTPDA